MTKRIRIWGQQDTSGMMREVIYRLGEPSQDFAGTAPTLANTAVGRLGSSQLFNRADARFAVNVATSVENISYATSTAGVADTFTRGDHVHFASAIAFGTTVQNVSWLTSTAGIQSAAAAEDHVHLLPVGTNAAVAGARTTSQTYTNNGTGPMFIMISLALSLPAADGAHLEIGGVDVAHGDGPANVHFFIMGIANPNQEYLLTATGGANIQHWTEYSF